MPQLFNEHCRPVLSSETMLDSLQIPDLLNELKSTWQHDENSRTISRTFTFKNYYETMAFVNASAWIAHQQDHHPDLQVSYNHCLITFTTHSINGLSRNDFICAARINEITTK